MNTLETGKDKIQKICEILKNETLDPAKVEAARIIEEAEEESKKIIREAEEKKERILKEAATQIENERQVFNASLVAAAKQAQEELRQQIQKKLFNKELVSIADAMTADPQVLALLINTIVEAIAKEGVETNLSAYIAKKIPPEKVNALLAKDVVAKLREHGVLQLDILGGVQIKLHREKVVLDLSNHAIVELLNTYLRKDFRAYLFNE